MKEKPKCKLCERKEGRDNDFGYPIGYYEVEFKASGRATTWVMCTKCNRCALKEVEERNGFTQRRKRVVTFKSSSDESSTPIKNYSRWHRHMSIEDIRRDLVGKANV